MFSSHGFLFPSAQFLSSFPISLPITTLYPTPPLPVYSPFPSGQPSFLSLLLNSPFPFHPHSLSSTLHLPLPLPFYPPTSLYPILPSIPFLASQALISEIQSENLGSAISPQQIRAKSGFQTALSLRQPKSPTLLNVDTCLSCEDIVRESCTMVGR